ncbi:MAG TPA: DivIVA domain-containing protein [Syntrophomonadaceae bacterium]|nr:DivIVA domain-containing protein [Syntrophomonadaceae bacterium]
MITAIEIRSQQFGKSLRGFDQEEVREFISRLAQDYETLYSDNAGLKEKVQRLEDDLQKYRRLEGTMNNTLILAQQAAEDLKGNARKEASLMLDETKKRISDIMTMYHEVIKRLNIFNAELKGQMTAHMEILETNHRKVEEMSGFFYGADIKVVMERLEKIGPEDL